MQKQILAVIGLLLLIGCANQSEDTTASDTSAVTTETNQAAVTVPHYVVERQEINAPIKASLTLRIDKKYTQEQIQAIATELRATLPQKLERVFMFYLTPGMKDGAGAYATSHFDPELKVRILGLSEAQTQAITTKESPDTTVLGRWENHLMKCIYTLRKRNGRYFMEMKFSDGSSGEDELFTKTLNGHQGFSETFAERDGYYTVERNGKLIHRSMDGSELYVYVPV